MAASDRMILLEDQVAKRPEVNNSSNDLFDFRLLSNFLFLGSTVTADGDCSHEIRRQLLHGRKVMTNLDSMLKSKEITLPTKVHMGKATVFPVVIYGCESWTIKKAECQKKNDTFKMWCWRRLLKVPWTARRSNQSILREINPDAKTLLNYI